MALTQIDDRGLKTPIDLIDNEKIRLGTGNDLELYHDGSHSKVANSTGYLVLKSNQFSFANGDESHAYIKVPTNEQGVELYYDNVKKFETTSSGVYVTGSITTTANSAFEAITLNDNKKLYIGSSDDLQIYHDGSNSHITNATGHVELNSSWRWADNARVRCGASSDLEIYHDGSHNKIECSNGQLHIKSSQVDFINAAGSEYMLRASEDGAVSLYHNDVKTFETEANGVIVKGPEGGDSLLKIYADEGDDNADLWRLRSNASSSEFTIQNANNGSSWDTNILAVGDGAVELYHDGTKRFETHATGGSFYPGSDASSVKIFGSNNSTIAATIGSTNSDEGYFRAYDGGTMKTWVEARGIAFGGDTADANFLDDYEEGTFTPTITGSAGAPSITYGFQRGYYTKIGNIITVEWDINFSGYSGGSGNVQITGLPVASAANYYHGSGMQVHGGVSDGGDGPRGVYTNANVSWFYLVQADHDTTVVTTDQVPSAGHWMGHMTYRAA